MNYKTRKTFSIYWQHVLKYKTAFVLIVIGVVGGVISDLYRPLFYKEFFDVLAQNDPGLSRELISIIGKVLVVASISWTFWRIATFSNSFFQARIISDIHNTCFAYLQGHSYNFFNNTFVGSLVRKVNRFARAYEEIYDQFTWSIGPTILTISFILFILYQRMPILAVIVSVWTVIYIIFNYFFIRYKLKFDVERAANDTKTSGHLADTITNNINLKLFGAEKKEYEAFKKLTQQGFKLRRKTWDLDTTLESVQGAFNIILEFGVMYVAIRFWSEGLLTIGDFALIQAYLIQLFNRLWDVGRYMRRIYESLADAEEMTDILMQPHEIQNRSNATTMTANQGAITFSDVTFAYNQQKIFENFSLSINPGERIAFVGASGGGKSTIVKLLFRFFDIQSGSISVDGQDISSVTQESLRENLSLVPQEPILFHRSLMENIRYAKPTASDEEVIKAAKLAHCHEFITGFPDSYETFVGERGVKLSGGERQRVAIARAILKNAPILVLDEATSSLDSESEMFIQDALKNLMHGKTTIVIAHRLSTIMQMDRIIVIEKGRIIEEGKHEELVKAKQGTYQKLWEIQAGGFT